MKHLEKVLASMLVLFASFMSYADTEGEQQLSNTARDVPRSRFSFRSEQVDREETIYLLTGAETHEEELEILEARIEQVRDRLGEGVSPDCRF